MFKLFYESKSFTYSMLLISNFTSSQSKSSGLEKIADSIYYNHDYHSTVDDFNKGLKLYTQLLSSIDNSKNTYYFGKKICHQSNT